MVGVRRTPGVATPGLAPLATTLLGWTPGWAWVAPLVVLDPYLVIGWAFA
jgi:hypothetical protein